MADINPWDNTFQATPIGTDQLTTGDDDILDTRETIRGELAVEHDVGDATVDADYTDTGRHGPGSARTFFSALPIVTLVDPTNAGAFPPIAAHNDRLGSSDLDNGRLWVDADDCQPYFREQEEYDGVNWTDQNTNYTPAGSAAWMSLWPRSVASEDDATTANELAGGADTREDVTGLTLTVACPDDGRSYEIVVTAHMRYGVTTGEHLGLWLQENIDAVGATDVDECLVNHAGGNTGTGGITLTYVQTAPAAGSSYVYTVQFAVSTAANVVMNPTNAGGIFNYNGAPDFAAGVTSTSRMTAELRPRYTTATY